MRAQKSALARAAPPTPSTPTHHSGITARIARATAYLHIGLARMEDNGRMSRRSGPSDRLPTAIGRNTP